MEWIGWRSTHYLVGSIVTVHCIHFHSPGFLCLSVKKFLINFYYRSGVQMRRNSWQDGVLGTNCPIPPKWNWTYQFQVKDQIGSFFYHLSLNFQRASGGFGPLNINNREIIPIPFAQPDGDIVIMIGDWYTKNHSVSNYLVLIFLLNIKMEFLLVDYDFTWTPFLKFRHWDQCLMLDKTLGYQMEFLSMARDLTGTTQPLFLMVFSMKLSMLIQVYLIHSS